MRHSVFGSFIAVFGLMITMVFTNCDGQSEGTLFSNFASSCVGLDCNAVEKSRLLGLRINHPETLWVYPWADQINVGGDCNEGGYEDSLITWRLSSEGQGLATSEALYADTLNEVYQAACVNGRFSLLIDLKDASLRSRTGLDAGSGPRSHTLEVEIFGIEYNEAGEPQRVRNPGLSPDTVPLVPICQANQNC